MQGGIGYSPDVRWDGLCVFEEMRGYSLEVLLYVAHLLCIDWN